MMNRRNFIAMGAVFGLVAYGEPGQQLDASLASGLRVTEVTATTSVVRKETPVPKAQIVEAARSKVAPAFRAANPSGAPAARVEMEVKQFYIANAVAGVLLGGNSSSINTQITLLDVKTDEIVKEPFTVFGTTESRPTILGAAAIKSPEQYSWRS